NDFALEVDDGELRTEFTDCRSSKSSFGKVRHPGLPNLRNDTLHVLLTFRSVILRHHASTVAFPGGRKHEDDVDDVATAMREAEEEIGLPPSQVEVVSCLGPTFFQPNYSAFPVVGFIPDGFKPVPDEVEFVSSVPLARFLQEDFATTETTLLGLKLLVYHFPCETERGGFCMGGNSMDMCIAGCDSLSRNNQCLSVQQQRIDRAMVKDLEDSFLYMCENTKSQPKL
ncbi:uncharacterized Nudix hydrolase NudL-like, partial [Haliotis rubra]|uniref:uncharacterized Nudix hydrolase NudL-like n=1 Tax=Haliotis rubra TaxID=36100 RepID=UPI001EE60484